MSDFFTVYLITMLSVLLVLIVSLSQKDDRRRIKTAFLAAPFFPLLILYFLFCRIRRRVRGKAKEG